MRVTIRTVNLAKAIPRKIWEEGRPVKRAELAALADDPPGMSQTTRERRVREAVAWMAGMGWAILSDGKGFRFAKDPEEFETAIRREERAAKAMLAKVSHWRDQKPVVYLAQLDLEFGNA